MEVAVKGAVVDGSRVGQLGLELIGAAQTVDGGDGGDEFLRGGWTHELLVVEAVDGRVGIKVPNHDGSLSGVEQRRLHQQVEFGSDSLVPRQQRVNHYRVVQQGVGHRVVGRSIGGDEWLLAFDSERASRQEDENEGFRDIHDCCLFLISAMNSLSSSGSTLSMRFSPYSTSR